MSSKQNGVYYADNIFEYIFPMKSFVFWSKFNWRYFPITQFLINGRFGDKPWSVTMVLSFVGEHMRQSASINQRVIWMTSTSPMVWNENKKSELINNLYMRFVVML